MAFTPHVELVSQANPTRWMLVLHGVFGSGANWRLFCKKLVQQPIDWGFALVDLRGHNRSLGAARPHRVHTAAADLLNVTLPGPVAGVMGHSLGGKIALAYASQRRGDLEQVWILDSRPGTRDDTSEVLPPKVLAMLRALPPRFADRQRFVQAVVEAGYAKPIAMWLAMNVRRESDGSYQLALELDLIAELLDDYFTCDLWPELEADVAGRQLHRVADASVQPRPRARSLPRRALVAGDRPGIPVHR